MRVFSAWPDLNRKRKQLRRWWRDSAWRQHHVPLLLHKSTHYLRLMRVDRPIGTMLLLWPTWWALWIAGKGHPAPDVFVVFTLGVIVMRAAGCIINDFADRNWDGKVRRTRDRPLATGVVSVTEAMVLFILLLAVALLLVLQMNRLTIQLSFVAAGLAILYPFAKRYTYLPQPVLGAAFGWSIPMAFAAQTGAVPATAWLLFIANLIWVTVYDTMYAMVDREDDLKVGIKSTAILFGDQDRLIIGLLQATLMFDLVLLGRQQHFGPAYYWAIGIGALTLAWHQYLIRHRKREACFHAFLHNSWFGLLVFAGIALHYTFLPYQG